jgi:hypothetical protein
MHMRRRSTAATVHHGDPLQKQVLLESTRSYRPFSGQESVPVFLPMVWSSFLTIPDRIRYSRLGILQYCGWETLNHPSHPEMFIYSLPWRNTCQDIVPPAIMTSYVLQLRGYSTFCASGMDVLHAVTRASTVKGTMLKSRVLVTSFFCTVSFLY